MPARRFSIVAAAIGIWSLPAVASAQPVLFVRTQEFLQQPVVRVDLSWSLPETSPDAVTFVVEAGSRAGAADLARLTGNGTALALTVPDVPQGRYWVRIRAVNYTGTSAPSNDIVIEVR